ncbi:MAG TPA: ankyrin repeat domain-containing protein, partial [Gemmataceae bacterium]|nr:ankyrin repeat domain-containing protein [Gemmataceae bacterium]
IRIWDRLCRRGHDSLRLRITDHSETWTMRKIDIDDFWHEHPDKMISIGAGKSYLWRVNPREMQGTFSWTDILEPNSGEDVTIVPLFEIRADAGTKDPGVWTGRVEGPAIKVQVINPNLATPTQYMWNACPRQALRMMKADATWINKRDPSDRCMPLHHASRFAYLDVVEWLLTHGAEVDARAYNDFSALYFADDLRVVRAILKHKPQDKELAAKFFRQPLENAASEVAWLGDDPAAKKWREIVQLMLDAGAPYSLPIAAYMNDATRVRELLAADPRRVDQLDGFEQRPLRIAATYGRAEICKILLARKADPNDWDGGSGFPILWRAIKHPAIIKQLIGAGADVKTRITFRGAKTGYWIVENEATGLHFAAQSGVLESAKLLLDAGVDVNARDTGGHTALDIAETCGSGDVAHLLAKRMGTPEALEQGWRTLLRQVVFSANSDRLKEVLADNAAAVVFAKEGPKFMQDAAGEVWMDDFRTRRDNARNLGAIDLLHAQGIPIDLRAAIARNDGARAKELLTTDPKLARSVSADKRPILHDAIRLDRQAIVNLLLDAGADPNQRDERGATALHAAAFWGRLEIAGRLLKHRADVNAREEDGASPLHSAIYGRSLAVVRLLLDAGADVNATDSRGRFPLSWAGDEESEMIDLLKRHGGR